MGKKSRKTSLTASFPQRVLLLVKFFLIQLGNIPVFLMGIIVDVLYFIGLNAFKYFKSYNFQAKNFSLPAGRHGLFPFPFSLHKKGRPRKLPFFIYYLHRFYRFYRHRIPLRFKWAGALAVVLITFAGFALATFQTAAILPSPTRLANPDEPLTTEFYDRNGQLLYRLYEGRNRSLVKLEELPKSLIDATIAVEDKNFYKHHGFDVLAVIRALKNDIQGQSSLQGASTITQQLIKNTLLTPEKTINRKVKEVILAFWAERIYTKNEILQMYFNEVPYGGPAWGIEAAAQTYFGIHAKDLNLAESAYLAGLPVSPTQYSPYGDNPNLSKERQKEVLQRMVEEGYISLEEGQKAFQENLIIKPPVAEIAAPHFVMYLKELLAEKYGARVVSQGGLKVYTSLDLGLQKEIERIVKEEVDKLANLSVGNGAAMVLEAKTGFILAMVGSKDYYDTKFGNVNVSLSLRQPGSSIKPITYAAAFKQGVTPATTILDVPIKFPDGYSPVNYDGKFHGPVSVRTALGSSYNIPAVKALATAGIENMIQLSKDMGITTFNDPRRYGLSLTLGGGEVKMIDMMSVYDTFSQMGTLTKATGIVKVEDSSGNLLEQYQKSEQTALQPEIAYLITHILADNNARTPAFGPNSLLNIPGYTVAVKTGTSDNKRDNWTFGYTPEYVVGVWVGNNDNTPMNPLLTSGITGAAPIWNRITRGLVKQHQNIAFVKPGGIQDVVIDGRRDIAVSGIIPKGVVRVVQSQGQTIFSDPFSSFATSSASLGGGANN